MADAVEDARGHEGAVEESGVGGHCCLGCCDAGWECGGRG